MKKLDRKTNKKIYHKFKKTNKTSKKKKYTKKNYKITKKKYNRRLIRGGNESWPNDSWGTANQISDPEEICPICFEKFKNTPDKAIFKTSCGHKFHNDCLYEWHDQATCPSCRTDISSDFNNIYAFKNKRLGTYNPETGQENPITAADFNGNEEVFRIYNEQPES
jgi:hypothetical protein